MALQWCCTLTQGNVFPKPTFCEFFLALMRGMVFKMPVGNQMHLSCGIDSQLAIAVRTGRCVIVSAMKEEVTRADVRNPSAERSGYGLRSYAKDHTVLGVVVGR